MASDFLSSSHIFSHSSIFVDALITKLSNSMLLYSQLATAGLCRFCLVLRFVVICVCVCVCVFVLLCSLVVTRSLSHCVLVMCVCLSHRHFFWHVSQRCTYVSKLIFFSLFVVASSWPVRNVCFLRSMVVCKHLLPSCLLCQGLLRACTRCFLFAMLLRCALLNCMFVACSMPQRCDGP